MRMIATLIVLAAMAGVCLPIRGQEVDNLPKLPPPLKGQPEIKLPDLKLEIKNEIKPGAIAVNLPSFQAEKEAALIAFILGFPLGVIVGGAGLSLLRLSR